MKNTNKTQKKLSTKEYENHVGADASVCPNSTKAYPNNRRGTGHRAQPTKTYPMHVGVGLDQPAAITLIALVITIIILIILAGVSLNLALGENGIFSKSKTSVDKYEEQNVAEKLKLAVLDCDYTKLVETYDGNYFKFLQENGFIALETSSINQKNVKISSREEREEEKGQKAKVNTQKTIGQTTKRNYYVYENGELYVKQKTGNEEFIVDLWGESINNAGPESGNGEDTTEYASESGLWIIDENDAIVGYKGNLTQLISEPGCSEDTIVIPTKVKNTEGNTVDVTEIGGRGPIFTGTGKDWRTK